MLIRAPRIEQAKGAVTRAGDYVSLEGKGAVRTAALQGKTVKITGYDIVLDGNVRADGDVAITTVDNRVCDEMCTMEFREGKITQNANVTSVGGDVAFKGYTTVKWPGFTSIAGSGSLLQNAAAQTRAAGTVTVDTDSASVGNIQAGKAIVVNAPQTTLTGRLVAPVITLPPGALNTEGNVRLKR
ncbi:hypothetical protein [Lysobacter auxotrophicus]|uniref:Polymer-forming cytoskeletal protein n=1 Tax=Lysobacter auxotrophicus TaxID=2992573 RepID=A0ABN6ULX1_9GAMM|nr:hypothetical protein [Lysobacter auxotrophicus]BDU17363.1 hypothetical protein LA521A_25640 [Lysobacter auxotrophicus]